MKGGIDRSHHPHTLTRRLHTPLQESAPYLSIHSDKPKAEDKAEVWTVEMLPKDQVITPCQLSIMIRRLFDAS